MLTAKAGIHKFPFSTILDGKYPATTDTPAVSITYLLKAEAIVARPPFSKGSSVTPFRVEFPLPISRCLPESDAPHHSIRVFPPTEVRASAHYNQVLHATKKNTLAVSLEGLAKKLKDEDVIECWKLKKAMWRLEETVRTVAKACDRHTDPRPPQEGEEERNQVERTETRILGEQNLPPTWKAEYSATAGQVSLEFDFGLQESRQHHPLHHHHLAGVTPRYACDIASSSAAPAGTEVHVTHSLLVELVVSRARASTSSPDVATETGTGRILRMRFRVYLSETGTGIAWDDEAPPLYADVPPSPPRYEGETDGDLVISDRGSGETSEDVSGDGEAIYAARSSADGGVVG